MAGAIGADRSIVRTNWARGPGHGLDGRLERLEVALLDLLAEKLIRDAEFQPGVAGVEHPEGPDPGIQHLGRKLAFQGREEPIVNVIAHGEPSYRRRVTHTLIHGGG